VATRPVGVADTAPGTAVAEIDVVERASPDLTTTTTADPGAAGTTLAVTSAARFPSTNNFKVRVENEVMLVTAGAGTTSWTVTRGVDNTTAVAHAAGVSVAQVVAVQRVEPVEASRQVSFRGLAGTFRTLGNAAATQNLFTIENASGSPVLVAIRRLSLEVESTAALAALANRIVVSRPTALPTAGTALTKVAAETALASSASVVLRGATASDGGAATAITATAGAQMWSTFAMRMHTLAGQVMFQPDNLLPEHVADQPVILRAGEALLAQVVQPTAANNANTYHYVVKCAWDEFTVA
jgi:hypothetical protein